MDLFFLLWISLIAFWTHVNFGICNILWQLVPGFNYTLWEKVLPFVCSEPPASFIWFSLVLALWKTFSNLFLFISFFPIHDFTGMCATCTWCSFFWLEKFSWCSCSLHVVSWFQSALPLFSFLSSTNPSWGERAHLAQNIWNVSTLWIYILVLWCFLGFILVFLQ